MGRLNEIMCMMFSTHCLACSKHSTNVNYVFNYIHCGNHSCFPASISSTCWHHTLNPSEVKPWSCNHALWPTKYEWKWEVPLLGRSFMNTTRLTGKHSPERTLQKPGSFSDWNEQELPSPPAPSWTCSINRKYSSPCIKPLSFWDCLLHIP